MDLKFEQEMNLKDFLSLNKENFEEQLFSESVNVKNILQEIKTVGNIDLVSNAHKLVELMVDHKELEIVNFAQQEGKLWAMHSTLNLGVKLEWFHAIRRVLWNFMYNYELLCKQQASLEQFYTTERQINNTLDTFLQHFFISYSLFKDDLIKSHKEMIDDLSVPIIPLTTSISILPLLGMVDTHRAKVVQEKVLIQIGSLKIETLIIDMSSVVLADPSMIQHLIHLTNGIRYMGCKAILTGIRPEIANSMIDLEIPVSDRVETKGTLQQTLIELGLCLTDHNQRSGS